jgi:hypothetical protein
MLMVDGSMGSSREWWLAKARIHGWGKPDGKKHKTCFVFFPDGFTSPLMAWAGNHHSLQLFQH